MAYIVGDVVLYDSTLYSNDRFKNAFIRSTSEATFNQVEKNFDKILDAEEKIILATSHLEQDELNEKEDLAEEIPSKRNDTSVSLLELTLGEDFNKKEEVTEEKEEKFTYVSPLEMIRGQQEVKELKDSLVEQLEEYYYKLNKQKEK